MSQTGFTPIQLYRTATASAVPSAANLVVGELAINYTDGKLFYEDNLGAVQTIASKDAAAGNFVNLAYTGTLTGGTGVVNIGSGQIYKDASGNVVLGGTTVLDKLTINTNTNGFAGAYVTGNQGGTAEQMGYRAINANGTGIFLGVNGANYSSGIGNANGAVIQALGAGTSLSVALNGATRLTIDPAGNAGLGFVPNAWGSQKALEFQYGALSAGNALGTELVGNAFYNGTNWIYRETGAAYRYNQSSAGHSWFTAPSGTAGNPITFTQAATLFQNGNYALGRTSTVFRLDVAAADGNIAKFAFDGGDAALDITSPTGNTIGITAAVGDTLTLGANGAEAARITLARYFKASNTGVYGNAAGSGDLASNPTHHFQNDANNYVVIALANNTGASAGAFLSLLPTGATADHYQGRVNNVEVYKVLSNGNVQNTNNSYGAISDAKLKENIVDAPSYLDRFMQLRFRNFNLKAETGMNTDKQFGVIAQELEAIFPSLVDETPDMEEVTRTRTVDVPAVEEVLDEEGNVVTPAQPATTREESYTESVPTGTVTKSVKYSVLAQMQGKVIQEQQAIINAQQTKIEELEGAVAQQTAVLPDLLARVSKLESLQ